jgi:hydroxypyruvate reductase
MTKARLSTLLDPRTARFASAFVEHTLKACDPKQLVERSMSFDQFRVPTHVIAFGKAAASMSIGCRVQLGQRFIDGIVLCPDEQIPDDQESHGLSYFGVDHPSPTARNVRATKEVIRYAGDIPHEHACVVCLSGGGSAHLCAPSDGVTLDEIIETTQRLNKAGASIHELNTKRKSLELLKGGGLARILEHIQHVEVCVLSDVMGDDLDTIASGPMRDAAHPIKHTIIGNHMALRDACASFAKQLDPEIEVRSMDAQCDATEAGLTLARLYLRSPQSVCIATGETTVDASGTEGLGGPCMEAVLAAGLELTESDSSDWIIIGLASDGIDGPTEAAGAVLTSETLRKLGMTDRARRALSDHDSLSFFRTIGGEIITGPSGTNVNDAVLICPKKLVDAFMVTSK